MFFRNLADRARAIPCPELITSAPAGGGHSERRRACREAVLLSGNVNCAVHDGANIDFFFLNPKEIKVKFGGCGNN
jgi:hypothetical protein